MTDKNKRKYLRENMKFAKDYQGVSSVSFADAVKNTNLNKERYEKMIKELRDKYEPIKRDAYSKVVSTPAMKKMHLSEDLFCNKRKSILKEDLQKSKYKDVIGKHFDYSTDFDFLDIVANVLDGRDIYIADGQKPDEALDNAIDDVIFNFDIEKVINYYFLDDILDSYQGSAMSELKADIEEILAESGLTESEKEKDTIWEYSCSGKIEKIKDYFDKGGKVDVRHDAFGGKTSNIMGALRNKQVDAAKLLQSYGETILDDELEEYNKYKYANKPYSKLDESLSKRKLNESGIDVLYDLIDRAKSWVDDGYDANEAVERAIDDGLIYTDDIADLAIKYGVIGIDTISEFYEDLYNDMYSEVSDYADEQSNDSDEVDESLKENLSKDMTIEDIAKKHNVSADVIRAQVDIGKEVEKEHTDDEKKAERIALDHLFEMPDYYTRLKKMEKGAIKEDTVKQGNYWVNKGKEGTHGKFKTKKAADAQRRAMFAQGFKESLKEDVNKSDLAKFIEKAVKDLQDSGTATCFYKLGKSANGTDIYYVIGHDSADNYSVEKYDATDISGKYVVVGKVAVNIDDLQSDYDFDWYMPYEEDGDVWDTETVLSIEDGKNGEFRAKEVIDEFNKIKELNITDEAVIVDKEVDESLKEDWYHVEYTSGANPYIAKSERDINRLKRKYGDKIKEVSDKHFLVDDSFINEDTNIHIDNVDVKAKVKVKNFDKANIETTDKTKVDIDDNAEYEDENGVGETVDEGYSLCEGDIDKEKCKDILNKDIDWTQVDETGDTDFALEQLRSLHTEGEITDDEYDYIITYWDDLLEENLGTKKVDEDYAVVNKKTKRIHPKLTFEKKDDAVSMKKSLVSLMGVSEDELDIVDVNEEEEELEASQKYPIESPFEKKDQEDCIRASQKYPVESPFKKKISIDPKQKYPVEHKKEENIKAINKAPLNEDVKIILSDGFGDFTPWSDEAIKTWKTVKESNKLDTLAFMLEDMYPDGITTVQLNDLLRFQDEWLYNILNITNDDIKEFMNMKQTDTADMITTETAEESVDKPLKSEKDLLKNEIDMNSVDFVVDDEI